MRPTTPDPVLGAPGLPQADDRPAITDGSFYERSKVKLAVLLYRPVVRRAARSVLEGRLVDPERPEGGRWLRADVEAYLEDVWRRVGVVLRRGDLERIPSVGNQHNVFLGALTIAAYHALIERSIERRYAMELFADIGWKLYARLLAIPHFFAGLRSRDPQRRLELTLRLLMRFPFSAPGAPGYEVRAWSEPGRFYTHWTYCAPLGFVQRFVSIHGDRGELGAFRRSWCFYDWAAADLLAGGDEARRGHYHRPHTLSSGDPVCDMCWSATTIAAGPAGGRPDCEHVGPAASGGSNRKPGDGDPARYSGFAWPAPRVAPP